MVSQSNFLQYIYNNSDYNQAETVSKAVLKVPCTLLKAHAISKFIFTVYLVLYFKHMVLYAVVLVADEVYTNSSMTENVSCAIDQSIHFYTCNA